MSSCTHVSESLPAKSVSEDPPGMDPDAAVETKTISSVSDVDAPSADEKEMVQKDRLVVEYVIDSCFNNKKRKLAQAVEDEVRRAVKDKVKDLDCKCGCLLAPCSKRVALRDKYTKRVAHKLWPRLEKELVRDLADAMWTSKRSNEWLSKELAAVTHENGVLKMRLAIVASVF
jgi:hypothetical protein